MALHLYNPGMDALAADPQDTTGPAAEQWSPILPRIMALPSGEAQRCRGTGALAPPAGAGIVLSGRVSLDVPLPAPGRAVAGIVPKRIRQRHRHDELRQRGHRDRHVDAVAARPRCAVVAASRLGAHLLLGATPYQLLCQYLANADSPTHGLRGQCPSWRRGRAAVPHDQPPGQDAQRGRGRNLGGRRNGEQVFGLAVIGDGGTSTGEFHESLNIASVHKVPVLFLIENNHYAFSTPTSVQYNCRRLSDRAVGYGISGRTIDGTDPWTVYSTVCEAIDAMEESPSPVLLECNTLRLCGHAAYDKGLYVPAELMEQWRKDDPVAPRTASPGRSLRPCRIVDCRHRRGR